jgi:hypothetical protein
LDVHRFGKISARAEADFTATANYAAARCPLSAQRRSLQAALTAQVALWGTAVDCGLNAIGTVPS